MTARDKNDLLALAEALLLAVAVTLGAAAIWQSAGGPRRDFQYFGFAFGILLQVIGVTVLWMGGGRMGTTNVAIKLVWAGYAALIGSCGLSPNLTVPRAAIVFGFIAIMPIVHALLKNRGSDERRFFSRAASGGFMRIWWPFVLAGLLAYLTLRFASPVVEAVVAGLLLVVIVVIRLRFRPKWNGLPSD